MPRTLDALRAQHIPLWNFLKYAHTNKLENGHSNDFILVCYGLEKYHKAFKCPVGTRKMNIICTVVLLRLQYSMYYYRENNAQSGINITEQMFLSSQSRSISKPFITWFIQNWETSKGTHAIFESWLYEKQEAVNTRIPSTAIPTSTI